MLSQTPASSPLRRLILLLWLTSTLIGVAHAQAAPSISNEILNFVPTCAQPCFEAFIVANFGGSGCGSSPSMPCLCTKTGLSGHTIGEGAMACVVAEGQRGVCGGEDTETDQVSTAYNMCVGVANAAPKTHSTIVATMIVPPGTGPSSSRTSTTSPARDLTTTIPTASAVTPTPATTSPSDTTSAATPETDNPAVQSTPPLTPAQIAGIVIGCLAVIVLGIVLVLLAKCVRRKRFPDAEAAGGFTKMRDSLSFGGGRKSAANSPPQLQISKPMVDPSLHLVGYPWQTTTTTTTPPRTRTPQPLGVGLALSPATHKRAPSADGAATIRSVARATPALVVTPPRTQTQTPKIENAQRPTAIPTLTLAIPTPPPLALSKKPVPPPATNARDSIVTEFAEDGELESATATTNNIWRPPPTDPQSATTYYAADKNGNWILRKSEVPAEELPRPAAQGQGWFSPGAVVPPLRVPSRTKAKAGAKLGSPIAFRTGGGGGVRSSSVYSPYPNAPVAILPGPAPPLPQSKSAPVAPPPPAKSRRRSTTAPRRRSRRLSTDSSTSIESGAALEDDGEDEELSPVVESPPVSPISPGLSPVTYPEIPGRQQRGAVASKPYGLPANPQARRMGNTISTMPLPRGVGQPGQVRSGSPAQRPPFELCGEGVRPYVQGQYHRPQQRPQQPQQQQGQQQGQQQQRPQQPQQQQQQRPQQPQQQRPQPQQQQGQPQQYQPFRPPQHRPAPQPLQPHQHRRLSVDQTSHGQQRRYPSPAQMGGYGIGIGMARTMSPEAMSASTTTTNQQRYPSPTPAVHSQSQTISTRTQSSDVLPPGMAVKMSPSQGQGQSSLAKRRGADGKVVGLALGGAGAGAGGKGGRKKGWEREEGGMMAPPPVTPGIRMMTPTRKGDDLFLDVGFS
ncbi:hypothetical protein QBC39DRAFT_407605 [Podospora conica]|nr:hypothetical protein QBC39DRAFT_407605 [Schizothecium conicum]